MRNFPYGTHADLGVLGELTRNGDFSGMDAANKWAHEYHFVPGSQWQTRPVDFGALGFYIGTGQRFCIDGYASQDDFVLSDDEFPAMYGAERYTIRVEIDESGPSRIITVYFNNYIDPVVAVDASAFDGSFSKKPSSINDNGSGNFQLRLFVMQVDISNGWEDAHVIDPAKVSDGAGNYVDRGSLSAEDGADGKLYDLLSDAVYTTEVADPAGYPEVYSIISVNDEVDTPVIELGSTGKVTMSNSIDPDAVTLSDGNKTFEFTISTEGATTFFDFPLTSDDTVPNLGDNLTLSVIKGPDVFTKTVSLQAPVGHTVRKLVDPIELDKKAYSNGMGFSPKAGDNYFWLTNSDFDITQNNICGPTGEPPFGYVIWHLSDDGLRKTNVVDGYGAINANPFMNAGPDQLNVAAGSTVILDASASYDTDGNIVSYEWEQTAGDDVAIDDIAASVTEFFTPSVSYNQTLSFKVTGTDEEGATGEATVNIGVLAVPIIPTISVAAVPASILLNETVPAEATVTDAVSVEWTANLAGSFLDSAEPITSFDATGAGSLTLTCTATSSTGHTASASATLSVVDPNDIPAPGVTIAPIASAMSGRSFKPEIAVVDNFGEGVTYAWSANSAITVDDAALERPAFTVPIVDVDTPAQISCTVTDANGKSTTAAIDVLLIPYVITIDDIDTMHFELVTDGNIQAFPDMLNREKISIRVTDDEVPPGLTDDNGLLILDHDIFDRIEIHSGNGGDAKKVTSVDGTPLGIRIRDSVEAHVLMGRLAPTLTLTERDPGFKMVTVAYLKGIDEGLVLTATQQEPTLKASTYKVNLAPAA